MREVDEVQCTNIAQKAWFKGEEMIFSHPPQLLTRESSIKTFSVFFIVNHSLFAFYTNYSFSIMTPFYENINFIQKNLNFIE